MSTRDGFVIDASAALALLQREAGAERVLAAIGTGAMSAVNLAEVLRKVDERGQPVAAVAAGLEALELAVEPFAAADALWVGMTAAQGREHGLSLGDRACLALAARLGWPVLSTDRAMAAASLGVEVELIR